MYSIGSVYLRVVVSIEADQGNLLSTRRSQFLAVKIKGKSRTSMI